MNPVPTADDEESLEMMLCVCKQVDSSVCKVVYLFSYVLVVIFLSTISVRTVSE